MLDRVDLSDFEAIKDNQGRHFPLLIASMLADLLANIKSSGTLPSTWEPLELCFAELPAEALPQIELEHGKLVRQFCAAGLATQSTLELFLPLSRYRRLLGAAQLNAFELTLSHGAKVSALLPGLASCFNHSCQPNVLISCGETSEVTFVAGCDIMPGDELCISYVDVDSDHEERRELLLHKYGFDCRCARCVGGD